MSRHTWTVRALAPIEDFNDTFGTHFSDEEVDTIGGLVMMELGRLPKGGESVDLDRFRFQVLRADNRRIHLLEMAIRDPQALPLSVAEPED